jgi:glycosyltransferase involved in cell wall biosynthesis
MNDFADNESSTAPALTGVRILALFGGTHLFGQERANLEVMRTAKTMGAEVRLIVDERNAGGEIESELERLGITFSRARFSVHWHYALRQPRYFLFNLSAVRSTGQALKREIREWRPTHLYLMNWNYFASGYFALKSVRLPMIYRAGDLLPEHSWFHRRLTRQLLRHSRLIVCNSQFLAGDMTRLGASPAQLRVIYNHPPERNKPNTAEELPPTRGVTLLFIGQIARHKGIVVLVDAVRKMLAEGNDITLWIAGESTWGDPTGDELRRVVDRDHLQERILFLGKRDDIPDLLRGCDIHVCPSIVDDPSPNVIMEAKREAVPTVAFSVGGIPELIQHETDGFLCRATTCDALIEGLAYFTRDRELRAAAGSAARTNYDRDFGFVRFQRQWSEVFRATMPPC